MSPKIGLKCDFPGAARPSPAIQASGIKWFVNDVPHGENRTGTRCKVRFSQFFLACADWQTGALPAAGATSPKMRLKCDFPGAAGPSPAIQASGIKWFVNDAPNGENETRTRCKVSFSHFFSAWFRSRCVGGASVTSGSGLPPGLERIAERVLPGFEPGPRRRLS